MFKNMINEVKYLDVYKALKKFYPDFNHETIVAHLRVLMDLKNMAPKPSEMVLHCKWTTADPILDPDCDGYWKVFGTTDGEEFGVDFVPWENWLGMETVKPYALDDCEFVAHCLYEMTFFGFNESDIRNLDVDTERNIEKCIDDLIPYGKKLDIQSVFK